MTGLLRSNIQRSIPNLFRQQSRTILIASARQPTTLKQQSPRRFLAMAATADHYSFTSGKTDPVWTATDPLKNRPRFGQLKKDAETDVLIIGGGIAGISTAHQLLENGFSVVLCEAREIMGGETGRTTGHLSPAVDDGYADLIKSFGKESARKVYDAQAWAVKHVGEVSKSLGIECEFRHAPYYEMVHVSPEDPKYSKENDLEEEYDACKELGIPVALHQKMDLTEAYKQGMVLEFKPETHGAFHPTLYVNGLLNHLVKTYPEKLQVYTHTNVEDFEQKASSGSGGRVEAKTETGGKVTAKFIVEATNVPTRTLPIIIKETFYRSYVIVIQAPKDTYPDILLYDNGDPYVYVRKTSLNDTHDLVIIGGEDHKVGFESEGMFENLLEWTKKHLPKIGTDVVYRYSGQITETNDGIPFIGLDKGSNYVITGDNGNGLTYGVAAGKIIGDLIAGVENPWADVFDPTRKPKARTVTEAIKDNAQQQSKYLRWLTTDGLIPDIEDIKPCSGAVFHGGIGSAFKPIAYYKDKDGSVCKFSAVCPHLEGIVKWNDIEKSWDCPNHGSRFAADTGECLNGPAVHGLPKQES